MTEKRLNVEEIRLNEKIRENTKILKRQIKAKNGKNKAENLKQ